MTPQIVTNVRLDEETNKEIAAAADNWFKGNKSEAVRELIALGLSAWNLGIRRQCQMRRIEADAWISECLTAVHEKWPDAEVSMSQREAYVMPDEQADPIDELIYRMVFAPTTDAKKSVFMAIEGVDPEFFTDRITSALDRA